MANPLYDNIDINSITSRRMHNKLLQPNFTRSRHIYKGHKESYKINLEIDQLRFDLAMILKTLTEAESSLNEFLDGVTDGIVFTDIDFVDNVLLNDTVPYVYTAQSQLMGQIAYLKTVMRYLLNRINSG